LENKEPKLINGQNIRSNTSLQRTYGKTHKDVSSHPSPLGNTN
jgi:hypothetical protein